MDNSEKKNELVEKKIEQQQLEHKRRADADRIAELRKSNEKTENIKNKTDGDLGQSSSDAIDTSKKAELSDRNNRVLEDTERKNEEWIKKQLEGVRLTPDEVSKIRAADEISKRLKDNKMDFEKQRFITQDASDASTENMYKKRFEKINLSPDEVAKLRGSERLEKGTEKLTSEDRLENVTKSLKGLESIKQENWQDYDPKRRHYELEQVGRYLRDAYECPDPPLIEKNFPEYDGKTLLGFYQDGADIDNPDGDYRMALNERVLNSNDAKEAVKTYCHEYRHAYQLEMVNRYEKPQFANLVHDKTEAEKWHKNFQDYKHQDDDYEQYLNQPVEKDAREFSEKIVRQIYETDDEKER